MDFGEVLGRAWQIIWKHKVLWIFGILAGCARGGGGGGFGGGSGWRENRPLDQIQPDFQQYLNSAGDWISGHLLLIVVLVLLFLVVVVLGIFLGTIGRIGLIRGARKADGGADRLSFGELFQESRPFFWRVFGLSFLFGLAFLFIVMPFVLLGVVTAGVAFICLIPLLCVLVPLALIAAIIIEQANVAMVTEDVRLTDGVRRGWGVVKNNPGQIFAIWLITTVLSIIAGIVIALPLLIAFVPAAIAFAASGGQLSTAMVIVGGLCLAVYLPIMLVANGILTTYVGTVWTLTYLRLTRPGENKEIAPVLPANA
jgi:hypothetical protein